MAGAEAAACRRVLVTGGTGFLGSAVAALCQRAGVSVRVGSRGGSSGGPFPDSVRLDVEDATTLGPALDGVDRVIHCAGLAHRRRSEINPKRFLDVNAAGTTRLVEAARAAGVTRFVLVSTVAVYGPGQGEIRDETSPCHPAGPYAESKLMGERGAIGEVGSSMALVILRLGTVYGERDPGNVARLIRTLAAGRFLWVGKGANRKTLIHRDDAARACLLVLERAPGGFSLYNAAAEPCPLRRLVGAIADALGHRVSRLHVPAGLARALAFGSFRGMVETWLRDDAYASDRIQRELGFAPEIGLEDGIRREVEWVSQSGMRRRS